MFQSISSKKFIIYLVKITSLFAFVVVAFFLIEYFLIPRISASPYLDRFSFLKKTTEKVTIINRTEQVIVSEGDFIGEAVSKIVPSVVRIISFEKTQKNKPHHSKEKGELVKEANGVVLSSDGLIATYRSAIFEKNARYQIIMEDGRVLEGSLKGIDDFADIAYLKVEVSNLNAAQIANSDDFRPGFKVISLARNSGDGSIRYAQGLISSFNKYFNIAGLTVSSSEKLEGVWETDFVREEAFIGGPLASFKGDLVAITGMVVIDNQKRFFHIPANVIRHSLKLLMDNKLEERAKLGVYYLPLNYERQLTLEKNRSKGALIYSPSGVESLAIMDNMSAQKAGLRIGDIILSVDGKEIDANNPLANLVGNFKKGETAELKVEREDRELNIKVNF